MENDAVAAVKTWRNNKALLAIDADTAVTFEIKVDMNNLKALIVIFSSKAW